MGDKMTHQFDIDIAKNIGIHQAILLNNLYFWIEKNRHNNQNFYDGKYWTYNSRKAFSKLFPYMSERQITYYLADMKKKGIIITGNYNSNLHDRTLWYAITDLGYSMLKNGEIDITKSADGYDENVKCIYNNNNNISYTDNKPYINTDKNVSADGDNMLIDETNDNPQTTLAPQNNEFPANNNNNNAVSSDKVENSKIYKDVVDYLNKKADTNFKHTSKATQTKIKARQNDGYALNDFYAVIDVKCSQWLNDKTMSKYLRPETLFGNKFEGYLNEKRLDNTQQSKEQTELERLKETDPVEWEKRRPAF